MSLTTTDFVINDIKHKNTTQTISHLVFKKMQLNFINSKKIIMNFS